MLSRRALFSLLLVAACNPAPAHSDVLAASEAVDPAFSGCKKSCGLHAARDFREARAQPGAALGDAVFCPVSGAVFRVGEETPKRDVRGKTLYFCCPACAAWFGEHEADVLRKRAATIVLG